MSRKRPEAPTLVVLTPVYNEEQALPLYAQRVRETLLDRTDIRVRVLFVEDGSRDASWRIIQEICAGDGRFSGLRLSRNFGSHIAMCAGFDAAPKDADVVCTLACDLQDPPEVALEFLKEWRAGADIVWGRRRTREDDGWRVAASALFNTLIRRYAMPRGSRFTTGSFLLLDRKVLECVRRFREHNRITFALVAWTGFEQAVVDYDRKRRVAGVSGWTFARMLKAMYDTWIGFSFLPIRLITVAGVGVSLLSLCFMVYLLLQWALGAPLMGWTSMMAALAFFFGLQFLLLGVVGEYLYRIYSEVVRRPLYFVSDEAGGMGKAGPSSPDGR